MAAVTIRELLTRLGVKADTVAVQRFDSALNTAKRTMVVAAGAAIALTGALIATAVATARQGDEAAKAAARVGVNAQEIQELGFAAEQTGAQLSDVESGFKRQARAALEASMGVAEYADTYNRLGVEVTDTNGILKPQVQLFEETADAISVMTNETEQVAVAQEIFGRAGTRLLPLLKQGAEGIREFRRQARELGFVLDAEASKSAEDFTDRMNEVRLVIAGLRNQIGVALLPVFTSMLEGFRDFVTANRAVIRQRIDKTIELIQGAFDFLRNAMIEADRVVRDDIGGWDVIFQQVEKAAALAGTLGVLRLLAVLANLARLGFVGLAAATLPVTLTIAALVFGLAAMALAFEDVLVFLRGGDSALGRLLDRFGLAGPVLEEFQALFRAAGEFVDALVVAFKPLGDAIAETLGPAFQELIDFAERAFDENFLARVNFLRGLVLGLTGAFQLMTAALTDFGTFAATIFDQLSDRFGNLAFRLQGIVDLINGLPTILRAIPVVAAARGGAELGAAAARGAGGAAAQRRAGLEATGSRVLQAPGTTTTTVNQAGDTFTVNGVSNPAEIAEMMSQQLQARNRKALAAARGGER